MYLKYSVGWKNGLWNYILTHFHMEVYDQNLVLLTKSSKANFQKM